MVSSHLSCKLPYNPHTLPVLLGASQFWFLAHLAEMQLTFLSKESKTWLSFASLSKSEETYQTSRIGSFPAPCFLLPPTLWPPSTGAERLELAGFLFQVCLRLPMLGLRLIDPLLLKHPAIDPPRERKKKKWKKNQLILNGLTKTLHSTGLKLTG